MGTEPILPVKRSISIDTMLNFDGDGDGTCKQAFTLKNNLHFTCHFIVGIKSMSFSTVAPFYFQKHGNTEYQSYTDVDISFDIANLADNLQSSETATCVFGLGRSVVRKPHVCLD